MLHSPHFSCYTPPFVPVTKSMWPSVTRKTHQKGPFKPAPKIGWPGTSNSRQSRPLSLSGLHVLVAVLASPRTLYRTCLTFVGKWAEDLKWQVNGELIGRRLRNIP